MKKNWDEYFLDIAKAVSTRATCDRLFVGCVMVKDKRILATGYNGSIPKAPHCDEDGHDMVNNHCVRTVHAEINAICSAARFGISLEEAICYITHSPCYNCFKCLCSSGIKEIRWIENYKLDKKIVETIKTNSHQLIYSTNSIDGTYEYILQNKYLII